jgi:hypothetical protein
MRHSPPISTTVTATATAFQQWKASLLHLLRQRLGQSPLLLYLVRNFSSGRDRAVLRTEAQGRRTRQCGSTHGNGYHTSLSRTTMVMRSSTVTTASGKAHQAMLLHTSGNILSLLEDIQQPLLLLHKPTTCSKGFTTWLLRKLGLRMMSL